MANKIVLMQGNEACVHGAIYAGYRFYAGYPITPSTEIAEISANILPKVGGHFIQMEDEIAGIAAAIGASIAGTKSMTATSGPGFSLKQENIGYAVMAQVPLVIVNVMRGGPSTGLPTHSAQGDIMQAKWGSHGDYPMIALSPMSVRETFDLTVRAFNLAEKYRTPVMLLTDEVIGHMRERVVVPAEGELEIINRIHPEKDEVYKPYAVRAGEIVPPMHSFGDGHRSHCTGLFYNETGFPSNSLVNAKNMLERIHAKVNDHVDDIVQYEEFMCEDAEVAFVTFGSTARVVKAAVKKLREQGVKVGMFRAITIWPSPEKQIKALAEKVKLMFVAEMNLGQYTFEVERLVKNACAVRHIGRANGEILTPQELMQAVQEALHETK